MVVAKTQIRSRIESDNAQREKKIAQLNDFIARFARGHPGQPGHVAAQGSRAAADDGARAVEHPASLHQVPDEPAVGPHALEMQRVNKAHGDLALVTDFSAIVNRGEKIVLVGRNGLGEDDAAEGAARRYAEPARLAPGHRRRHRTVGTRGVDRVFAQDHTGAIEKGMTAVEWLHRFDPDASRQDIHGLLGQMLFSGEEGLKPTEALSGGETARLLFCRIMLQKPNVLVLDEPTNHLDLESINALNVALQKFEGTVLLVTHDQDLMEEVGTRVWHFDNGTITDFKGTYEDYAATLA